MNLTTGDSQCIERGRRQPRVENPRSDLYRHRQNLGMTPDGQALTMIRAIETEVNSATQHSQVVTNPRITE